MGNGGKTNYERVLEYAQLLLGQCNDLVRQAKHAHVTGKARTTYNRNTITLTNTATVRPYT